MFEVLVPNASPQVAGASAHQGINQSQYESEPPSSPQPALITQMGPRLEVFRGNSFAGVYRPGRQTVSIMGDFIKRSTFTRIISDFYVQSNFPNHILNFKLTFQTYIYSMFLKSCLKCSF